MRRCAYLHIRMSHAMTSASTLSIPRRVCHFSFCASRPGADISVKLSQEQAPQQQPECASSFTFNDVPCRREGMGPTPAWRVASEKYGVRATRTIPAQDRHATTSLTEAPRTDLG
jgi:hypothetical protein